MLRFSEIKELVDESSTYVTVDDEKKLLCELDLTEKDAYRNYAVTLIGSENGFVVLKLQKNSLPAADADSEFAKEYKEQNGAEPSFF